MVSMAAEVDDLLDHLTDNVNKGHHIHLQGQAGTGKTVLLKEIIQSLKILGKRVLVRQIFFF